MIPGCMRLGRGTVAIVSRSCRRYFISPTYQHIHLHKQGNSTAAVSYLASEPTVSSKAVVGWCSLLADGSDIDLSNPSEFKVNTSFMEHLNDTCLNFAHEDPMLSAMAATQDSGHIHIADEKNPPPFGRIPYPEDIIGTMRIEHGALVKGSFVPMREAYRPVSGNGIVKVSEFLENKLIRSLKNEYN